MEFVAAGWCTRKWLRLDQTIRNLTSGDLGISLVVIGVLVLWGVGPILWNGCGI